MARRKRKDIEGEANLRKWLAGTDRDWLKHRRKPMTALERQHKHREADREIADDFAKACASVDWERRRAALESPRRFIAEYCMDEGGIFDYLPFKETDAIIDVMLSAARSNVPYHLRMTRGGGKTTLFIWLAIYLLCRHEKRFIVLTAAKMDGAAPMIEDIAAIFISSPALIQDFPEFSLPLVQLGGSMQRAASQRFLGRPTLCRITRKSIRFPMLATGCPLLPGFEGGAIVIANGFDAKTRGLRVGKRRPDFILLDDLQDDEMANNPEQVEKARQKIYKTYMKLGSAVEKPSILMASTPIAPGDLSESIANDPNWKTETFPLMHSMPNDAAMKLWKEYKSIKDADVVYRRFSEHNELKFYIEKRGEMDAGAEPMWKDCFLGDGTEVSAVQHAMNLYLEDEDSFLSEYQMAPRRAALALDLPREVVATRVLPGSARRQLPPGFVFVAVATDINPSYALTTTAVAFKPDRTAFVLDHIISPITIDGKTDDSTFNMLVYNALAAHGRALRAAFPFRVNAWGIDGSGRQFNAATAFAKVAAGMPDIRFPCCAMLGRAAIRFNPMVKSRLRDAVNSTVLCCDEQERAGITAGRAGAGARWIFWDADRYKEAVHRALLTDAGAPGGCTLYAGGDHVDFAIQVTNEKLKGKRPHGDGRDEYVWESIDPHDYLDTMAMCYAIAAHYGIAGGIAMPRPLLRRKPKKIRIV